MTATDKHQQSKRNKRVKPLQADALGDDPEAYEIHEKLLEAAESFGFVSDNANDLMNRAAEDIAGMISVLRDGPPGRKQEAEPASGVCEVAEAIILLPNGGTLRSGPDGDFAYGGYVRICDPDGNVILYWDPEEWGDDPVLVMGEIFGAALKSIAELTADRTLEAGAWLFDESKRPKAAPLCAADLPNGTIIKYRDVRYVLQQGDFGQLVVNVQTGGYVSIRNLNWEQYDIEFNPDLQQ